MGNLQRRTEFSRDEMKKLLLMVGIGEWVLNGFRDEPLKEFESVEQKFYRFAVEHGLGDCFDHGDGERLPNKTFEDSILKYIKEYEDNVIMERAGTAEPCPIKPKAKAFDIRSSKKAVPICRGCWRDRTLNLKKR